MGGKFTIVGWMVEPGGSIILLTLLAAVLGENSTMPVKHVKIVLKRCSEFYDSRNVTIEDILIPANLTNSNETVTFG